MAVIAFMSAKGSPGVTTTALLCAALWPRPALLVDADTDGGDVALRLRLENGEPVDRDRGLLSLLSLARRELSPAAVVDHGQVLRGGLEVVSGLSGPDQAGAAQTLWDNLGRAFSSSRSHDVLVDCGRVSSLSTHLPLLRRADLLVAVARPTVSGVIHTRDRLIALQPFLGLGETPGPKLGLLVVADSRDRDAQSAAALFARDLPDVEQLGTLADDAEGAGILAGQEVARPERALLVRSAHPVVDRLFTLVGGTPQPHVDGDDSLPGASAPARPGNRVASRPKRFGRAKAAAPAPDLELARAAAPTAPVDEDSRA